MTDRERDAAALDAVLELADGMLELAEGSLPQVPTADRHVWISVCMRLRRLRMDLLAGEPDSPPPPTHRWN